MSINYDIIMGDNNNIPQRLGIKIRCLRKLQKIAQMKLAEKANLNFNFIGQIERAETNPSLQTLISIANALDVEIKELFNFTF